MRQTDLDGFLAEAISTTDGVLGLLGFDDDRPVAMWSHYQAQRVIEQLPIVRRRVAALEWALADVTARGLAASVAKVERELAEAREALAGWEWRRDLLEAARRQDAYAPRTSPFDV